jgi:hypothetical protein
MATSTFPRERTASKPLDVSNYRLTDELAVVNGLAAGRRQSSPAERSDLVEFDELDEIKLAVSGVAA